MKEAGFEVLNDVVRFFGRTSLSGDKSSVFFNWSGSGFEFRFKGSAASALLVLGEDGNELPKYEDRAYISIFIDGQHQSAARFPIDKPSGIFVLAENLNYGEHIVKVVKETEVGYGRAAIKSLMTDGEFCEKPKAKKINLEFIGDSITCGYGNLCSNASSDFVTREEDFSRTYAAIAADMLNADLSCIAASGNGFYHDYGCSTHNLIPELYLYRDKMLDENYGRKAEKWNFKEDRVDAVIIKLGQNDAQFCSGADLSEAERTEAVLQNRRAGFEDAARNFLNYISVLRPKTPIICLYENTMLLKPELISATSENTNIHLLEIPSKTGWEGVGANGHWSLQTHSRVALSVAEAIRRIL